MLSISKRLKQLRKTTKLTQAEFSEAIGVRRTCYQSYEDGRAQPTIVTLVKVAEFYSITLDELVMGASKPKKDERTLSYIMANLSPRERKIAQILLHG